MSLATPFLMLLYWGYRVASLEAFRRRAVLGWRRRGPEGWPKRILAVRLDTIGDVLLSEPAIRSLKQAFPEAQLHMVVGSAGRAVLAGNPCINRVIVYNAPWHAAWRGRKTNWRDEAANALRTVRELRRYRYDLAVELRGDPRDIALMAATGATMKVGNGWRGGGFMLDLDAPVDVEAHRVDFALGIAAAVGASAVPSAPKLSFGEAERQQTKDYLPTREPATCIAMHLGAGFPSKCLPVETFAEIGAALVRAGSSEKRQIVLIGGSDDRRLAQEYERLCPFSAIDTTGELSLSETAALLERCALFIGNDSGPMHLAAAVGTPVVACFGPSEPHKYHPYMVEHRLLEIPLPCRPCDHVHCSQAENICMTRIAAADVVAAAEELLRLRPAASRGSAR